MNSYCILSFGLYARISSFNRSGVGPHFAKPASFWRNTMRVPCPHLTFVSFLQKNPQSPITCCPLVCAAEPVHSGVGAHFEKPIRIRSQEKQSERHVDTRPHPFPVLMVLKGCRGRNHRIGKPFFSFSTTTIFPASDG